MGQPNTVFEFGQYRLDLSRRMLFREGKTVALPPKTFGLLVQLVESRDRLLTKEELMSAIWPDTLVDESNLAFQISTLRKAMGDGAADWIETVPKVGYRFGGTVAEVESGGGTQVIAPPEPEEPGHGHYGGVTVPPVRMAPRERVSRDYAKVLPWAAACVAAVAALVFAALYFLKAPPARDAVTFDVQPPFGLTIPRFDTVAISPDGRQVVFVGLRTDGTSQLWIRDLASRYAEPLGGTDGGAGAFWSPDSRFIAFFASGKLKKLDLRNRSVQVIASVPLARGNGSWGQDDVILFDVPQPSVIYRVAASGGEPIEQTVLDTGAQEVRHESPQFLPDGRSFIFFVRSEQPANSGTYLASVDSASKKQLLNSDRSALYAGSADGPGYLLYSQDGALMGRQFNSERTELVGVPFLAVQRVLSEEVGGMNRASISASQNDVLAYRTPPDRGATELVWYDRQGRRLSTVGDEAEYFNPALSPDERTLIVSRSNDLTTTTDLWRYDLKSGAAARFSFDPGDETNAVWAPDGSRVVFNLNRKGVLAIYEKPLSGASEAKLLFKSKESNIIHSWSPDGRYLLYQSNDAGVWALPMEGTDRKPLGPFKMASPRISPDGRWVTYTSNESGQYEVYVQQFPPTEGRWQVSVSGGREPTWRKDGKELFYTWGDALYSAEVRLDEAVFHSGPPELLFRVHLDSRTRRSRYAVAANGERFLISKPIESLATGFTVALQWNHLDADGVR